MNEDTIIVGSLEKGELEKSINELVSFVEGKTNKMAEDFTQGLDRMKLAMKDFAITQKVSVDLMKEAWRSMSSSFDAMVAAESTHGGGRGRGSKPTYDDDTVGALRESVKHEKKLREEMKLGSDELRNQNRLIEERQRRLKQETATQRTLNDITKMQESSVEEVSRKMAALKKARIDPKNAAEVKLLGDEYQRLSRLQATLLGKNIQLTHSNNYLAQSFGYIRNRVVYALTLGAMTNFVKQIYEVRGQYELLERSLGILIDDMDRGSEIFNELNEMALKSPFTLTELATGAKQLVAYNFAENEVVDTTRRLGDISAALGVPMERLVYNLGQIRAQTVLNARDARDFANAGLAIVPMLAQLYTEQKRFGDQVVTTAQVYDMMSKKMVSYGDVMQVINKITDEGGKFYDFQAKQAETLRVQINNLTLAFNNMLNDIGKEHQGILTAPLRLLKSLFENWRQVSRVIMTVITTLGIYKTVSATVEALNSRMFVGRILVNLRNYINGIRAASGAMATFNAVTKLNAIGFLASALTAVLGYFVFFKNNVEETTIEMERFGESGAKALKKIDTLSKILQGTDETSSTYKKTLSELSQITSEYGVELDAEKARREDVNKAIENTIELIKQESAERQRANELEQAREQYDAQMESARKRLNEVLSGGFGVSGGGADAAYIKGIKDNAGAVAAIIEEIVTSNIGLIINKSGDELDKGIGELYDKIDERLKRLGIRGGSIEQVLGKGFLTSTSAVEQFAVAAKDANETLDRRGKIIDKNKKLADEETKATMSFTDKVKANSLALQKNASDALALYNNIYEIVDIAKKNHVINFDLKLTAQEPPKWMFDKSLPELQQLAQRFAAIAKSGGHAKGYDVEGTYERALQYASAARTKQEEEERKAREKNTTSRKNQRKDEDVVAKALKEELSLIKEIQSNYTKLRKAGVDNTNAINMAAQGYELTLERVNNVLSKYGINKFNASDFAGKNVHEILDMLTKQRDALIAGKANTSSLKEFNAEINKLTIDAKTYDMKKITDGLNNELGKLKDEYELAVELNANPELGDMFANLFDIDPNELPSTIDEYAKRVTNALNESFEKQKKNFRLSTLDLTDDDLKALKEESMKENGIISEEDYKNIEKYVKDIRQLRKKDMEDTIKQAKDLQYKLADVNGKVAIEYKKLAQLQQKLEKETTEEKRKLLERQIQDQENVIKELQSQALVLMPEYKRVFGNIAEYSDVVARKMQKDLKAVYDNAKFNLAKGQYELVGSDGKTVFLDQEQYTREYNKLNKEMQKSQSNFKKIKEAFSNDDGIVDWVKGLDLLTQEIQKAVDGLRTVADIFSELGGSDSSVEVLNDVATTMEGIATAGQGVAQIASGDYIGGTVNVIKGTWDAISTWFDNKNKKIDRQIENSTIVVRKLELEYQRLEYAAKKALGSAETSAERASIANKELQLAELERQLVLEQQKDYKKDSDQREQEQRIDDYKKEIESLRQEIQDMKEDIVNNLLGEDVKSAAESFVDTWVDAWKSGETTLDAIQAKMNDMVENLVKKAVTSAIVGRLLQPLYDAVDEYSREASAGGVDFTTNELRALAALSGELGVKINEALGAYYGNLESLGVITKNINNGESSLSALQAGIQGITEDTAGALEGYMNGVSQQVYLQSDILTQIRDTVVGFDFDVSLGVMSQILLQLQTSYQTHQAIQAILEGWSSPNGMSVRVEMV